MRQRLTSTTRPIVPTGAGASNGTQPTSVLPNPMVTASAASAFNLRDKLRTWVTEQPETDRETLIAGFVNQLDDQETREALRQSLRGSLNEIVNTMHRQVVKQPPSRSSRFAAVRESHRDGSLDRYRRLIEAVWIVDGRLIPFGEFTVEVLDRQIQTREMQAAGIAAEVQRLRATCAEMRSRKLAKVALLHAEWLTGVWFDD